MIEQTFYTLMTGTAAITAIVSTRIHHLTRPENETGAALVYQRVVTTPVTSLSGDSGLDAVRLQVACYAADNTHSASMALAQLVRDAVKTGLAGTTALFENDEDPETGIRRTLVDFNLWQ
jgi:hypothetical protein